MTDQSLYKSSLFNRKNADKMIFISCMTILLSLLIYRLLLIYSYNGEIGGFDNNFIYDVMRSLKGMSIYTDPSQSPYAITLYPPFYYNVCTLIGKIIHINIEEPINVYRLCRCVSFICDFTTGLFLYYTLKKNFFIEKKNAFFLTTVFVCIICHLGYTFSRCDSLLLSFYSLFIFILTNNSIKHNTFFLIFLSLLCNACLFSKQNGVITILMTVIWLIINNEKKLVLKFLLFSLIGLLVILFVYSNIFHYKFLYANTIKALQNRIDLSWFYTDIFKRSINSIWILPIYAACLIGIKNHFKPRSTEDKALAALFLVQIVFSLGTSLKWGSSAGYLNESFVLSFIIIAREISSSIVVTKLKYAPKIILFLTPLLVLFAIHTNAQGYLFFIQNRAAKKEAYEQQKEVSNYLQAKLDGHYVIDQSWPGQNFFKADLSKELAVPNVDIVGCCTFPDKTFNYSKLANDITDGNIKYIIQADTILPHELWGGSLQHFTRDTTIHGFVIFRYHEPNNLP